MAVKKAKKVSNVDLHCHYWGQISQVTYVKLKEQISLLGGNLIICTKCQVMDFRALAKVHALKQKHKQKLVKLASDVME